MEVIRDKKEISLNSLLDNYNSWSYAKVVVVDDKKLQGYVKLDDIKNDKEIFGVKSPVKQNYYNVFETQKPITTSLSELWFVMTGENTIIQIDYTEKTILEKIFSEIGPIILFLIILIVASRFILPKSGGLPFSMKAGKLASSKSSVKTKFNDVAWMEEVKNELSEIVDYLKNPQKYIEVWARHPKWVLLYWPPGSGKTLLARAVAGESNVPFFSASGSEFMEMLVGMWAAKVRDLFNKAKTAGTAIIFIDEIDAIGKKRWVGHTWWHQEQEQTLNQILTEMDWFERDANIVVIAATNREDTLDPALLRAWRFDRKIMVSAPTYEERIEIFNYYFKWKTIYSDVDVDSLAKRTSGLVWADIENIVNEAALKVAKDSRKELMSVDFEYALEKVLMWPEKVVRSMLDEEKKMVAYHELGHAVLMHLLPNADPVEKISIVRRWHALWSTWTIPKEDKYLYSKSKFLDEVTWLLGWRVAEELFFGKDEITTWAANDFEKATNIISALVATYWMDDDLWTIVYRDPYKSEYEMYRNHSEKTAEIIDKKIHQYMTVCFEKAKKIISEKSELIHTLARVLLEKEYLSKKEFSDLIENPNLAESMLVEFRNHKLELDKKKTEKKDLEPVDSLHNSKKEQIKWMLDKFLK